MHPTDHTSIAVVCSTLSTQPSEQSKAITHIIGETEHDLGSAIPPRSDVLCHEALVRGAILRACGAASRRVSARKAEVTYLELAVRVNEQVTWL